MGNRQRAMGHAQALRIRDITLTIAIMMALSLVLAACGENDEDTATGAGVELDETVTGATTEPPADVTTGTGSADATPGVEGTDMTATSSAAATTLAEASPEGSPESTGEIEDVTIGLTFVPNIQFSPFYVAIEKGFYEDVGLDVTLNHHAVGADQFGALVAGQEDMLMAAGDEVLQARANGAPLVYVAQVYRDYPVALIVPADSDIQSVTDLAGMKVGIPGEYGANYVGLLALLESAGLTRDDIEIESVGFTQASALLAGHVDAVMGYINNEPIQLEKAGMEVRTFPVADVKPLVSNGLVSTEEYLSEHPEQAEAIVQATLRGVEYVIANPEEAVEISKKHVPTLEDPQQADDALAVLQATIPLWTPDDGEPLGAFDPEAFAVTAEFLTQHDLLPRDVDVEEAYSTAYVSE